MRWTCKFPTNGTTKVVTKFLWFPLTVDNKDSLECRWFETATIKYRYSDGMDEGYWKAIEFIDSNKEHN